MKRITPTTFMISLLCGSINSLDAQAKDKAPAQKAKQPKKPNIRDFRKRRFRSAKTVTMSALSREIETWVGHLPSG
mgnify:FL=1